MFKQLLKRHIFLRHRAKVYKEAGVVVTHYWTEVAIAATDRLMPPGRGHAAKAAAGKAAGFSYVTLDLAGYRTGSHNELLRKGRSLPVVS